MPDVWDQFPDAAPPPASQAIADPWARFPDIQPEQPSPDLGRGFGLAGRALTEGALSLPTNIENLPLMGYNAAADYLHGPGNGFRFEDRRKTLARALNEVGLPQPETPTERLTSGVEGALGGVATGMGAGSALSGAVNPTAQALSRMLLSNPGTQAVTAGTGAVSGGAAAEMGASPAVTLGATLLGGATPTSAVGIERGLTTAGRGAVMPFTEAGRQNIAGQVLHGVGGNFEPEALPLGGLQLTPGQRTNNPGLMYLEDISSQKTPTDINATALRQGANNAVIQNAITSIGEKGANAPEQMSDALAKAYAAAKARTQQAWRSAGLDQTTDIPKSLLTEDINNHLGTLTTAERSSLPSSMATLDKMPDQLNLNEIQGWRSQLLGEQRAAARSGNGNQARIAGGVIDTLDNFLDTVPQLSGGSNAEAYSAARGATRQLKQTYTQPAPVRAALGVDQYGADKLPESATADAFIRSGKGAPEALDSYLNAIKGDDGKYDPTGIQAARNAFSQKFLDTVTSNAQPDINGVAPVAAPKVRAFVDDFQHVINSPILTNDQRDLVQRIAQATNMVGRNARAQTPGAQTYARLAGDKYLDALIGPAASKLMPIGSAAAGAAAGSMMGPIEAFSGAVAAGLGEDKVSGVLYGAARDKVMDVLDDAIKNPEVATALMKNSGAKVAPGILGRIRNIIGSNAYPASILASHLLAPQNDSGSPNNGQ